MSHLKSFDVLNQAVPASVPARVRGAASALEPGIIEDAIANLAPLRRLAVDGEAAAHFHLHDLRPAVPGVVEQYTANPQILCLLYV